MKSLIFFSLLIISAFCITDDSFLSDPTPSVENLENLGVSNINILSLLANYCNSYCGYGQCDSWSTGNSIDGNKNRIYCNGNGVFCDSSTCYYPCMDKSPDTKVTHFAYGTPSPKKILPQVIISHHVDNSQSTAQTGTYAFSQSIQNSYSWSWSTTLTTSLSFSVSAGIPDVCDLKEDFSISVSNTQSQSQSKTTTKTWTTTANYVAPARATLAVDYIVSKVQYVVPFTMTIQFGGQLAMWCVNQVNGHWFWMPNVGQVIGGQPNCNNNVCTFTGYFTGVQGVSDQIKYRTCKLGVEC